MNAPTPPAAADAAAPAPRPTFDALALGRDVRAAIDELGYEHPTPVQLAVYEPASRGKSLVVQARTGTGKTAAFGLPIVDALVKPDVRGAQALVLTPTRELALQVGRELGQLAKNRGTTIVSIYGGTPMGPQIEALEGGAQVIVGTPGRVLDHLRRGTLDPSAIRIFVLDEADEMLSMGFARELNAIIELLPKQRQGLYFSATLPPDVERLATNHLKDPEWIALSSDQVGALSIAHFVYLTHGGDKRADLVRIIEVEDPEGAIVFCNTKDETERTAEFLKARGYDAEWLNGDLDQRERERVMAKTREGKLRFLVATDVAARGIDISHLTHVINHDFPESTENYVHRTGRTGRAGRTGTAISLVGPKDVGNLYMLRLTYKIRPVERSLPTAGELRTRAEADLVTFLVAAFGDRPVSDDDLALARRLLTHDAAERIVAGLVRDHLGARPGDANEEAAAARRAKNPPPVHEVHDVDALAAGASAGGAASARPREDRPARPARERDRGGRSSRDEAPRERTARDGRPREDRPASGRGRPGERAPAPAPREVESQLGGAGDDEGGLALPSFTVEGEAPPPRPRDEAPRRSREPREARAPREPASEGEPAPEDPNFARIFLNVGRRDGVRVDELTQLLSEHAGIQGTSAAQVAIRDRITFVSVPKDQLDRALETLAGREAFGRTLVAEVARPRATR